MNNNQSPSEYANFLIAKYGIDKALNVAQQLLKINKPLVDTNTCMWYEDVVCFVIMRKTGKHSIHPREAYKKF